MCQFCIWIKRARELYQIRPPSKEVLQKSMTTQKENGHGKLVSQRYMWKLLRNQCTSYKWERFVGKVWFSLAAGLSVALISAWVCGSAFGSICSCEPTFFFNCYNLDLTKRGLRNPILSQSHNHSLTFSTAVIHGSWDSIMPVITHGHFGDMKIVQVNMKTFLPLPWACWAGRPFLIAEEQQGVTLCTGQSN